MNSGAQDVKITLGHLALHYPTPEAGPIVARLLETIGFQKVQEFPLPQGGNFYQFYVDPHGPNRGDGIVYLSPVPAPIAGVTEAIRQALRVGAEDEHPSVRALREGQKSDPEMCFHLGLLFKSLECVEDLVITLCKLNETDPDLKGRIKVSMNAARPGDAEIDARMAASPIFAGVTRYTYGGGGIQVFVETDLLMSGPLGESMVIELDYVFPDRDTHLFNATVV